LQYEQLVVLQISAEAAPPVPKRCHNIPNRFRRGRIGAPLASQETLSPSLTSSFCSDIIFLDDDLSSCHRADLDESDCSQISQVESLHIPCSPIPSEAGHSI